MKVSWKIALYNLVFHQLPLIQHCSVFYKKNAKHFRRIQRQNMLRMHLPQSRISKLSGGEPLYPPPTREGGYPLSGFPPLGPVVLGSCLRHSTLPLLYKLRLLLQFFLRTLDMPICFYQIFLVSFNILFESKNELKKTNKSYLIFI